MKIKTAWLRDQKYLIKALQIRIEFPEKFKYLKIEAGKLKAKFNPNTMR